MGGPELALADFMKVVEAASAGRLDRLDRGQWRRHEPRRRYLPKSVASEWFADPSAFIASATGAVSLAEPVAGGYRVTDVGRSAAAPGMPPDSWGLAAVKDGSGNSQAPICCYFAREHVTVHDTWHVSGLRGTGSRP